MGFIINDADTVYFGTKFLRILCIATTIYPVLFVIIAVFQAVGQSVKPFLLSLLNKGSLDIVLFFLIRRLFGLDYILWASPTMSVVALMLGLVLMIRFFRTIRPIPQ